MLAAMSKKTEVDDALEALKARLGQTAGATPAAPAKDKEKEKISSAFDDK